MEAQTNQTNIKYCLYARKSSEAEEQQALSIDSQIKEMLGTAQRDNLKILDIYRESHSAKACGQRPVFNKLLIDIREGKFDGVLVWHPDRLSRNAGDLGALVDLLDQKKLVEIRTHSQRFTNNPNEKFLLMILGSQAKLENDNKSINVKRGMRARCEMGLWPSVAPTGYLNSKTKDPEKRCVVFPDPARIHIIKEVFIKYGREKWSGRSIHNWLLETRFVAKSGKPLTLSNIYTILANHFYYGTFEYPKNSGKWYQGKYIPAIDKSLFDDVQLQLQTHKKVKGLNKEFAFTRLFYCGLCGSGVTAQEKYKNLADGSIAKYIYYGCTRGKDPNCKEQYIEEKELIKQLANIIDQIDLDRSGLKKKLEAEIERHKKFHSGLMGKTEETYHARDADIRNYAKYLMTEGSIFEKRDLLSCLKTQLQLKGKIIVIKMDK